ncbi:MAG TPA: sigma-70 family RNA polymerase sigma factor [Pyrinomonadaceae bacterium]|nr:sigma-70 family RNA polymerase sigma factor [Chloracidobacterium sp.]MBP9934283.1 sigma-70 family RNA polymerase sigma factor [Pyrinomonadaceae bacterium]MBK7801520.1 sigma-70 family RNA polymerase sigma factor [Chloracidobacterium sp.]MBK9437034.1 sigma-70 family RNA polymerase sigma factor [Chloracidobacterium sp.]MBK9766489.1 sigma-70 family RNA polymerase sigma factor [Chloracidobacterium sp.]
MSSESYNRSKLVLSSRAVDLDDAELVRSCRNGDQTAWDQLVTRYQRLIFAIPRRAGLNDEQAADVFQEVFLTLLQKIDDIEQPDRIRSWMVTTAKFKTWAIVRSGKGHYSPETEEEMEAEMANLRDVSPLADDMLIEVEEQHLIRTALLSLEERCQKILSMIYLRDPAASYVEVSAAINVGETSISPMRSRCLKKLEKLLSS